MVGTKEGQIRIDTLLRNFFMEELSKVAREHDSSGNLLTETRTYPGISVGNICLRFSFQYDDMNDPTLVTGQNATVQTWTQALEDLAIPPIIDIVLSSEEIIDGDPAGTKVADISASGGTTPFVCF